MKIVFNAHDVGLGNNGGSRTIIRSAETLRDLGHEVLISGTANRASWFKTDIPFVRKIPECDALIATGYHSVKTTKKFRGARTKLWYVRGHEVWQAKDHVLWDTYASINVVTNSSWIHEELKRRGTDSKVIYQGIDFDQWYRSRPADLVVGGISHPKQSKRSKDCLDIAKRAGYSSRMLNRDIRSGKVDELRDFYSSCAVWVSASENEGLQNVPIEATLCGAALVLTDHPQSGNADYGINDETCMVYRARAIKQGASDVKRLMEDEALRNRLQSNAEKTIKEKIGDRPTNMRKLTAHIEHLISEGKR